MGKQKIPFKTLEEFINVYHDKYYPTALPAPGEKNNYLSGQTERFIEVEAVDAEPQGEDSNAQPEDFSGQTEKFIEVEAVDAEPQGEDPNASPTDFSGQTEKLGEFFGESILHFLKIMEFSIGFGGDKKTPGTRVVPNFFTEEILRALARSIEKDRTKVKHMLTKFMVDKLGTFEYEITLYGRKQNFSVFCGTLAGILTDYMIKEFKGKEK